MGAAEPKRLGTGPPLAGRARVFVSFDLEHDADLRDRLARDADRADAGFEITGCSAPAELEDPWQHGQRRHIRHADVVVILCGEHTDTCRGIEAELRMAREEGTPYFLVWGRREGMCKLPAPAPTGHGMYSWTPDILRDRIRMTLLEAGDRARAAEAAAASASDSEESPGPDVRRPQ